MTERSERVLARIRRIPRGSVLSYGVIDPEAPRFVGALLARTDADVPWHRVVHADGSLPKGDRQRTLLLREGVPMRGKRVDMERARARRPR
ncbi:MAG TPA: MGMT family protein [Candidatus Dormibacteraeota bacterium]|nr:MGMT family protein [Candidatus Dormibacteraeota bacterium]